MFSGEIGSWQPRTSYAVARAIGSREMAPRSPAWPTDYLHHDAAFLGDARRRDHVDVQQHRAQQSGDRRRDARHAQTRDTDPPDFCSCRRASRDRRLLFCAIELNNWVSDRRSSLHHLRIVNVDGQFHYWRIPCPRTATETPERSAHLGARPIVDQQPPACRDQDKY
jgi:hypothetical protein